MKIGFLSQAAICGHTYVNRLFARATDEPHILVARGLKHHDPSVWQDFENKTEIEEDFFHLPHDKVLEWARGMDAVFFNEIEDWELIQKVGEVTKTIGYLVSDRVVSGTEYKYQVVFDAVIICNEQVYEDFSAYKNTHFVPWGVEPELFGEPGEHYFVHSAGWGGVGDRKCTPEFARAMAKLKDAEGILLTQRCIFDGETTKRIRKMRSEGRLKVEYGDTERTYPGRVYVGLSRHEGLGLYFPEAMACGLPVITTDAPPMNQFVSEETGLLVKPKYSYYRQGMSYPAYEPDFNDFLKKMRWAKNNPDEMAEKGRKALEFIKQNHSYEQFKQKYKEVLETTVS